MRHYIADLHIHSVLSPCAAVEMTPRNIVLHAAKLGVHIIAITDHNAGDNVAAAQVAAAGTGVTVLAGMEVETKEEVHLVTLFGNNYAFARWQRFVRKHLPPRLNDEGRFGAQFVVDAEDNLLKVEQQLLLTSLDVDIATVTKEVTALGGLCIASHIDRPAYSILSQLGFIPSDVNLAAVEVSRHVPLVSAADRFKIKDLPIITASDAHTLAEFISGPKTVFFLEEPTFEEIRQALAGENQRRVVVGD